MQLASDQKQKEERESVHVYMQVIRSGRKRGEVDGVHCWCRDAGCK